MPLDVAFQMGGGKAAVSASLKHAGWRAVARRRHHRLQRRGRRDSIAVDEQVMQYNSATVAELSNCSGAPLRQSLQFCGAQKDKPGGCPPGLPPISR